MLSAPGRTEIGGNHTDHQHGRVLAAAVDVDLLACAAANGTHTIRFQSEGWPLVEVDLSDRSPRPEEKESTAALIREAETDRVQAVLYGHTHVPDIRQTETGLWVVNPGSSGLAGTAAVLEIENERIKECYLVSRRDLEE